MGAVSRTTVEARAGHGSGCDGTQSKRDAPLDATELQHEYVVWYDDGKELAELRVFAHKPKLGDEFGDASTLAYTFAQGVNTALALMVDVKS